MTRGTNLRVYADDLVALFANVGEDAFVALDAIRVVVSENISLTGQGLVTLPAGKMTAVPVLRHSFRVFSTENELEINDEKIMLRRTRLGEEEGLRLYWDGLCETL